MKKDSYLMPRGLETMESLVSTRYFCTMDLKSGFWQVKMSEESHQYTAFTVGSMDVYEFLRMPYGLCNAPATFQHLMQNCLGELNLQFTLIYLDNVIIYSRTQEDHLTCLQAVLDCFTHHRLKLKRSKCHFFKEKITYLGHEISAKGMLPGQEGIQKIANMGPSTTVTGIRKFVGAVGYFRHFIKNFSCIARLLDDLTSCENSKLKNHPVTLMPHHIGGVQNPEKEVHDSASISICRFGEALCFGDRHIWDWPWSCVATKAGGWKTTPHCIRQQGSA